MSGSARPFQCMDALLCTPLGFILYRGLLGAMHDARKTLSCPPSMQTASAPARALPFQTFCVDTCARTTRVRHPVPSCVGRFQGHRSAPPFAAQDVSIPVERPADMITHLRNMPAEDIARKQEALRVARSRLFYMALPHSHGPTGADVLTQHMCRRAGRVPPVDAAVQRTLQRHGALPSQTVPSE